MFELKPIKMCEILTAFGETQFDRIVRERALSRRELEEVVKKAQQDTLRQIVEWLDKEIIGDCLAKESFNHACLDKRKWQELKEAVTG